MKHNIPSDLSKNFCSNVPEDDVACSTKSCGETWLKYKIDSHGWNSDEWDLEKLPFSVVDCQHETVNTKQ